MDSQRVLKWHLRAFKLCGLWPPENGSFLYNIWIVIFISIVNIGFPISQLVCVLWVDSVDAAVDNLIITSSVVMVVVKGLDVLAKKKTFVELLRLMMELDATVTFEEYERILKQKFLHSDRLLLLFCVTYIGAWSCIVIQVIMSDPVHKLWSSTYLYPNEFLHRRDIYVGGIIFQATSNLFVVLLGIFVDTYGAILLQILGGHIEILSENFQALGEDCTEAQQYEHQGRVLIDLCKKYLLIIRFEKKKPRETARKMIIIFRKVLEATGEYPVIRIVFAVWCERIGFMYLCISTVCGKVHLNI